MPSRLQLENIVTQWVKVNDPSLHIHIRIDGEECTLMLRNNNTALLVKPEKISNEHEAISVMKDSLAACKVRLEIRTICKDVFIKSDLPKSDRESLANFKI